MNHKVQLRIIPYIINNIISNHKNPLHKPGIFRCPFFTYAISPLIKHPTTNGRVTKITGLYKNAALKSNFEIETNIRVIPQAGHLSPVIKLKIHGMRISVIKTKNRYKKPTTTIILSSFISFFNLCFISD